MKIGVIGVGALGSVIRRAAIGVNALAGAYDRHLKDFDDDAHWESALESEIVYICVPAKTNPTTWAQDLSEICDVLNKLTLWDYRGVVCLKTTLLPGTTRVLASKYALRLVHSPDFSARTDPDGFGASPFLISGDESDIAIASLAYRLMRPKTSTVVFPTWEESELAKYFHNGFLAVKLSFCNEIQVLCERLKLDYNFVRGIACSQGGIGPEHSLVPGPDGKTGFEGKWLAQDANAFLVWTETGANVFFHTLGGAVMTNRYRRPNFYKADFDEHHKAKKDSRSGSLIDREKASVSPLPARPPNPSDRG